MMVLDGSGASGAGFMVTICGVSGIKCGGASGAGCISCGVFIRYRLQSKGVDLAIVSEAHWRTFL